MDYAAIRDIRLCEVTETYLHALIFWDFFFILKSIILDNN